MNLANEMQLFTLCRHINTHLVLHLNIFKKNLADCVSNSTLLNTAWATMYLS